MLPKSANFNYKRCFLGCILFVLIALVNFIFFTDVPNVIHSWTRNISEARTSHMMNARASRVSMCFHTYVGIRDIINARNFSSQCSIDRLTRLNVSGDSPSSDSSWEGLYHMAKNPLGTKSPCPRKLKMSSFPIPRTALLSFPGSGNTWMRHLLQQLTGIHTGSIYPFTLARRVFHFEGVLDNVIVVKSHEPPAYNGLLAWEKKVIQFDRLLILLRDPYASIMAEFKRQHVGKTKNLYINPRSSEWIKFVMITQKQWARFVTRAFNTTLPSLATFYEDLHSCLLPEMVKVSLFLRNRNLEEFGYCCTNKYIEGEFHRKPSNQTIEDAYPSTLRNEVNTAIQKVANVVRKRYPEVAETLMRYIILP